MKKLNINAIKAIQMDILSVFDDFCRKHEISYSIADGTLLGAVRHKGYIPWDDDIDVVMLRADYEKFLMSFPKIHKSHYRLAALETDRKWTRAYANLYDDRTLLVEEAFGPVIGVNIDIFPVDEVPDSLSELNSYFNKLKFLGSLYVLKTLKWRKNRNLFLNFLIILLQMPVFIIPLRLIAQWIDKYAKVNNNKGFANVYECCFGISSQKPFPKSLFDKLVEYQFEERKYLGFSDSDTFLKQAYGDYMKLPPVEKQVTHHSYHAFWK